MFAASRRGRAVHKTEAVAFGLPLDELETRTARIHLLLPFCSSVLAVVGLLFLKRAQENGVSTWSAMILVCWSSACVFPLLTLLGGTMQPLSLLWQPAIIGFLFLAGQFLTFLAVKVGDVSIAAPVHGSKVLMVPLVATLIVGEMASANIWLAAAIALVGIVFVQSTDATVDRARVLAAVVFALLAAAAMTLFDLLIQRWAPAWGAGYFLPIAFAFAGLFATAFLALADRPRALRSRDKGAPLLCGSALMAIQAIGMTFTLAQFGDATRVNIVYSLRGLWGVILTWVILTRTGRIGKETGDRIMLMRLVGALLITASVILAIT